MFTQFKPQQLSVVSAVKWKEYVLRCDLSNGIADCFRAMTPTMELVHFYT